MNKLTKLGWFTLGAAVTLVISACTIVAFVAVRQKKAAKTNSSASNVSPVPATISVQAPATSFLTSDWSNAPGTKTVWLANKTSAVAHSTSTCSNMNKPIESTKSEVDARGSRPCLNCWDNT